MKMKNFSSLSERLRGRGFALICGAAIIFSSMPFAHAQTLQGYRDQGRIMLGVIKSDVKKNYYDSSFHGVDIDARFKEADEQIKAATSIGQVLAVIAQTLMSFNDSHLFFDPPGITARIEHGWRMQMIGDKCYVVAVQPGSDAEARGLKPGDRVLSVENYAFTRGDLWKLQYIIYNLSPRPSLKVVVVKPDGEKKQLDIAAKVHEGKMVIDYGPGVANDKMNVVRELETLSRLNAHRTLDLKDGLFIWKMPGFFNITERQVNEIMDRARKHKTLVLDMRGNPGGSEDLLLAVIGNLFDHDVNVGELKRRKETKPLVAKTRGDKAFKGQLVVLVDSDSGSSAEILARVVQLEKRGTVIGDRTAGAVMRSRSYDHELGSSLVLSYGVHVTDADLVMSDGQSLEHTGVKPDEMMLPTAVDLAAQRDPVLWRALVLGGINTTPEKAGAFFPIEWRK